MTQRERYQDLPADQPGAKTERLPDRSALAGAEAEPIVAPHVLIGLGMGGFFDGIVLHQILQWHHLVSARYPPTTLAGLELNTLADGLFHGINWVVVLIGLFWLLRMSRRLDRRWSRRSFFGGLLVGWGLFNVLDQIVNHMLLNTHHIRPGPTQLAWDMGFTLWGLAMLIAGGFLLRAAKA